MHLAAVISMSNPRLDLPSLLCHQSMSTVPPLSPCSIHFSFSPPFPSFCLHFGSNVYDFPSWLCPSAAEGPTPARKKTQGPTQKHTQSDPKPHLPSSHTTTAPHDDWWLWFNELLDELLWRLMFRLSMMMMKSTHYIWSQRMNLFHFGHSIAFVFFASNHNFNLGYLKLGHWCPWWAVDIHGHKRIYLTRWYLILHQSNCTTRKLQCTNNCETTWTHSWSSEDHHMISLLTSPSLQCHHLDNRSILKIRHSISSSNRRVSMTFKQTFMLPEDVLFQF